MPRRWPIRWPAARRRWATSDLSQLSRALEHALLRSVAVGSASEGEAQLFNDAADDIRHLLHQFAAGFLKTASTELLQRLEQHELDLASAAPSSEAEPSVEAEAESQAEVRRSRRAGRRRMSPSVASELGQLAVTTFAELPPSAAASIHARADALDDEDDIDAIDAVDDELFPIFQEEGEELLPQLQQRMRDWARRSGDETAASACMRTLHTFKGGARLAGAMRLGEMAHRLETAIEHLLARGGAEAADVERLLSRVDAIASSFEQLGRADAPAETHEPAAALPVLPQLPEPTARRAITKKAPANCLRRCQRRAGAGGCAGDRRREPARAAGVVAERACL